MQSFISTKTLVLSWSKWALRLTKVEREATPLTINTKNLQLLRQYPLYELLIPKSLVMLLNRLAHRVFPTSRIGIRLASTILGKSGREYVQREVLAERKDPPSSIFKAEYVT